MTLMTPVPGAHYGSNSVKYCIWSPDSHSLSVEIRASGETRSLPLEKDPSGYHFGTDPDGKPGDIYGFRRGGGPVLPDPASRFQYETVHGPAVVVDPSAYKWNDSTWKRPPFRDVVIYELHIGTFTPEGTFKAAIEKLPHLRDLGITAIEIMPIADFPGTRNWGYDGVLIYAPAKCYGAPDDLRALVDAAHSHGIAVILDVVYNHFGPDGNYFSAYSSEYFHKSHHTPWGNAFNFELRPVRDFFLRNPLYWMDEFHIDGFRFDATHEIEDDSETHILAEITAEIHARGGYAIAEDARNNALVISSGVPKSLGFDGVWADDFHHTARVTVTGEQHSYYQDFKGGITEVIDTLQHGWLYRGQQSIAMNKLRGTESLSLAPEHFVFCITNHDQTGNRALGERLNQIIHPDAYRALTMLLCLSPYTPMLFMGQEWGASTPFLFFTDHNDDLGRKITEGRRKEFSAFPEFSDPETRKRIPDPQALSTFEKSKLRWEEAENSPTLALYKECLALRRTEPEFRPSARDDWKVQATTWGAGVIAYSCHVLVFDLKGGSTGVIDDTPIASLILSTEEPRFGGTDAFDWDPKTRTITFKKPGAALFATG
jgi:maltooligosyltrehalose trehalohydrolase